MFDVSIIIPIYNVEKHLNRCMESILKQTLRNYEVILVDDGSPDNCSFICDQYAEKYSFIRVIHKNNGGLSSARNAGLKAASGKYVGFVDSDDDIESDMYEQLFKAAEEHAVDFVMTDYTRIDASSNMSLMKTSLAGGFYDKIGIKKHIFPCLIMGSDIEYGPLLAVWRCLYKRDFLKKNQIWFDEEVRWSEDNIFSAIVGYHANSFYYIKNRGLYHYYQNPGTITTSYREGAWKVYTTMNEHLRRFFQDKKDYNFTDQLNYHLFYYACNCINQAIFKLKRNQAIRTIKEILAAPELEAAYKSLPSVKAPLKLRIQLELMKRKYVRLLYWMRTF